MFIIIDPDQEDEAAAGDCLLGNHPSTDDVEDKTTADGEDTTEMTASSERVASLEPDRL